LFLLTRKDIDALNVPQEKDIGVLNVDFIYPSFAILFENDIFLIKIFCYYYLRMGEKKVRHLGESAASQLG